MAQGTIIRTERIGTWKAGGVEFDDFGILSLISGVMKHGVQRNIWKIWAIEISDFPSKRNLHAVRGFSSMFDDTISGMPDDTRSTSDVHIGRV